MSWVCCWPCFSRADAPGCIFYWKSGTLTWKYWLPTCGGLQHKLRVDVSCWNAPWESCFCTFFDIKEPDILNAVVNLFYSRFNQESCRSSHVKLSVGKMNAINIERAQSELSLRFRIWFFRSGTKLPTNTDEKQVIKHLKVHSADVLELLMSSLLICVSFKSKLHFYNSGMDSKYAPKINYFEYLQFWLNKHDIIKKVRNELWGSVFILRYPLQSLISLYVTRRSDDEFSCMISTGMKVDVRFAVHLFV